MRFVTTLTSNYVPALHALLGSLRRNAGIPIEMTVVTYDEIPASDRAFAESIGIPLEWIPVASLGEFPAPATMTERMRPNFNKPLIWRLPYDEPLLYIDTDILCLRPLTGIEEWDELSAVKKQTTIGKGPDSDPEYLVSGMWAWNAGLFCFRPSEETLAGIMQQAREYTRPLLYGDQVILNDYFNRKAPEKVRYKSFDWNMSTWVSKRHPDLFRRTEIKLLHFAHDAKPWLHPPEFEWQEKFWRLWWDYYNAITQSAN